VQAALASNTITAGHAGKLLRLKPEQQAQAVAKIAEAAAGKAGHERAKAQRAEVAKAARGKREVRAAIEQLPESSIVRAALLWTLGELEALPE
jgi:ParB family chromosome partitioning protein